MGRIECPLLLVNGDDDQNWATTESAEDVSSHTLTLTHTRRHRHADTPWKQHQVASFDFHFTFTFHILLFVRLQMLCTLKNANQTYLKLCTLKYVCIHDVDYAFASFF